MKKTVITGVIILMLLCLAGIEKSSAYTESGSSAPSEAEVKEAAVNAMDNDSVPPVVSETNTLYVKADTSGHETFASGEEKTIPHYIYWTDPNEVFGYFLMGYLKITFDPAVVEPVMAQSGAFSTRISRQGPGWIIVDPWMWYPGESDPNLLAFNITWRGLQAGTTGFDYTVTDSSGNYRGYFLTGTVHNMQRVTALVEFSAQPPTAPTNLVALAVSPSQINLTWEDKADNEQGFIIERALTCQDPFVQIATVGEDVTSYANTDLSANTVYYYRVKAYNQAGDSAYSNKDANVTFADVVTLGKIIATLDHYYEQDAFKNPGIYTSLSVKLTHVQSSINANNYPAAIGHLNSLMNELNALNEQSITQEARDSLLTLVQDLVDYLTLTSSLPATFNLYLHSEGCENTYAIDLPTGETVYARLAGDLTVCLEPTSDSNILKITVTRSSYRSLFNVGDVDFGVLQFTQDPNNPSLGTLDLSTGRVHFVEKVLATSSYLDLMGVSPLPMEVFETGNFYPMSIARGFGRLVCKGIMPAGTPLVGGLPFIGFDDIQTLIKLITPGGYKSDPEETDPTPEALPPRQVGEVYCAGVKWSVDITITILDELGNPAGTQFDCMTVEERTSEDGGQNWGPWTGLSKGATDAHIKNGTVTDKVTVEWWTIPPEWAQGMASCKYALLPPMISTSTIKQQLRIKLRDGTYKVLPGTNTRTKSVASNKTCTVTNSH